MTVGEITPESREDLVYDKQEIVEWLSLTDRGRETLGTPGFRDYLAWSLNKMSEVHSDVLSGELNVDNVTPAKAKEIYHLYPSFLLMRGEAPVLEIVSAGTKKQIDRIKEGDQTKKMLKTRRLASITEELSVITIGETSSIYGDEAARLNRLIAESDALRISESPRKLHAVFSVYDIYFRRLGKRIASQDVRVSSHELHEAKRMLANSHLDLADTINGFKKVYKLLPQGTNGTAGGAVGELLVLGRFRDLIDEANLLGVVEASQDFLRQGHPDSNILPSLPNWSRAFDITTKRVDADWITPVEVKKKAFLAKNPATEERRIEEEKEIARYLPIIHVILFRLGWNHRDYLNFAETYCRASAKEVLGEPISIREEAVLDIFRSQVDVPIMGVIQSHLSYGSASS